MSRCATFRRDRKSSAIDNRTYLDSLSDHELRNSARSTKERLKNTTIKCRQLFLRSSPVTQHRNSRTRYGAAPAHTHVGTLCGSRGRFRRTFLSHEALVEACKGFADVNCCVSQFVNFGPILPPIRGNHDVTRRTQGRKTI